MKIGVALSKPKELLRKFTKCLSPPAASRDTKHGVPVTPIPTQTPIQIQIQTPIQTQTQTQTPTPTPTKTHCGICMEDVYLDEMFYIPGCKHSYCLWCMSKHVENRLHDGRLPRCPHGKCTSQLTLKSCETLFLSNDLLEVMRQLLIVASVPAADRIYCPNPTCSALFSKRQFPEAANDGTDSINISQKCCPNCKLLFCIDCKVPWHRGLKCYEYRNSGHDMVMSLASENSWRQCPVCNHMVSLGSGCYHIYCRCGHQFCYKCGAAWKDNGATCKCPVWDEQNRA